ncbi:MAG: hypothetical protein WBZ36_04750 [Candidatus Nitrosopolaris sp.]
MAPNLVLNVGLSGVVMTAVQQHILQKNLDATLGSGCVVVSPVAVQSWIVSQSGVITSSGVASPTSGLATPGSGLFVVGLFSTS